MKLIIVLLIIIYSNLITPNMMSIVTFPKNPFNVVFCSTTFDNINSLISIQKIELSTPEYIESKFYDFQTKKYAISAIKNMVYCGCEWYDNIIDNYFSLNDILNSSQTFNSSMSRTLSIFFSGSWLGEIVSIDKNNIISPYWNMKILIYDKTKNNLSNMIGVCQNKD